MPDLADIATMANLLVQHGVAICVGEARSARSATYRPRTSPRPPRPTIWSARCAPRCWCSGRCWRAAAGAGVAAGRLRDRHAAGRSAHQGAAAARRQVELNEGYIEARAPKGLRGAEIVFPSVSVGATENLLMAATLAEGETVLINAAREPEITDLADCLIAMGAQIDGIGSDRLRIRGVGRLHGAGHTSSPTGSRPAPI